jgi:subtilase family serine protease/squalene cyclase
MIMGGELGRKVAFVKPSIRFMTVVAVILVAGSAYGQSQVTAAIDGGTAWLAAEQSEDGAWGKQPDAPASAFAIQAMRAAGQDVSTDVTALASHQLSTAGDLALQLLGTRDTGLVSSLQALRNPDGSYGGSEGEKVTTTGLALLAQALSGSSDPAAAAYLRGRQGPDGAWGDGTSADETGLVLLALLTTGDTSATITAGLGWLTRNQSPDGDWGTVNGTAWALLALTADGSDPVSADAAAQYLLLKQLGSGGFARRSGGTAEVTTTGLVTWALADSGVSFDGVDAAIAFLAARRNADAGWYLIEIAVLDTTAVLDTFHILSRRDSATALAVLWILQRETPSSDFLARRLGSLYRFDNPSEIDLNLLLSRQRADGGWGAAEGFESTVLDTVIAIDAIHGADDYDPATLNRATQYLVNSQRADGSWGLRADDETGTIWATALAMQALKHYRTIFDLEAAITDGRAFLEAQQLGDGGWGGSGTGTVWETALAFSACMKAGLATSAAENGVAYLLAEQLGDGSWNQDPYDTALAMRALAESKPNLQINDQDISFSAPGGVDGDTITISAVVHNSGGFAVDNAVVQVFLGDPHQGGVAIGGDHLIATLAPGASTTVDQTWDTTGLGGDKNIYVLLDPAGLIEEGNEHDNKAVNRFRVSTKPDLALGPGSITYTPENPDDDDDVIFTVVMANIGETPAVDVMIKFYRGTEADPYMHMVEDGPVTIPPGGVGLAHITTRQDLGTWIFTAVLDPDNTVNESNESNNSTAITVNIGERIDLMISSVTLSDTNPAQGDVIQATAQVYNGDSAGAVNVNVGFYLNGTHGYVPQVGTFNIPFLAAGATVTTDVVSIPTMDLPPGDNTLVVEVDPENQIAETDEANNRYLAELMVHGLADLIMGNDIITFHIGAPDEPVTTVARGTTVTILAPLSNAGAQDAHKVTFQLFNGDPRTGAVQIGEDQVADVIRYKSGPLSGVVSDADPIPYTTFMVATLDTTGMATGTYPVYGWIDPENAVLEPDDDNNLGYSVLEVGDESDPAPKAGAFTVSDTSPEEGDLVTISGIIENRTATPVPEVTIKVWDGHPQFDPPLLYQETFSIAGSGEHDFSFSWSTDLQLGAHTMHLVVDPDDTLVEYDETNNSDTLSFEVVQASSPDLTVSRQDISFTPAIVAQGETVTIRALVTNLRRRTANNVAVRFIRVDPSAGEVQIGSDQVIPELAGATATSVGVDLDTSLVEGSALIMVRVDPENRIGESNESNNTATSVLRLRLGDGSRPSNLAATVDLTDVYLSWDDSSDPEVTGYQVERNAELINPEWQEWARSSAASASCHTVSNAPTELVNDAAAAVDGTRFTYWECNSDNQPDWLALRFRNQSSQQRAILLKAVTIVWKTRAEDYLIQVWDGYDWVTVRTITGNQDSPAYHLFEQAIETERVRIYVPLNQYGARPQMSISEIRVHALRPVE